MAASSDVVVNLCVVKYFHVGRVFDVKNALQALM